MFQPHASPDLPATHPSRVAPALEGWAPSGTDGGPTLDAVAQALMTPTSLLKLTRAQALKVAACMQPFHALAGTVLLTDNDQAPQTDLMVILKGQVRVETRALAHAAEDLIDLGTLTTGDILGAMAFLDGQPRAASYTARTDVITARLSREALETLARQDPTTATHFMTAVCLRLATHLRHNNQMQSEHMELARSLQALLAAPPVTPPAQARVAADSASSTSGTSDA